VVGVMVMQLMPHRPLERLQATLESASPMVLGTGFAVAIVLIAATVPGQGVPPFIYFRF